jgi:hypothetical protein
VYFLILFHLDLNHRHHQNIDHLVVYHHLNPKLLLEMIYHLHLKNIDVQLELDYQKHFDLHYKHRHHHLKYLQNLLDYLELLLFLLAHLEMELLKVYYLILLNYLVLFYRHHQIHQVNLH